MTAEGSAANWEMAARLNKEEMSTLGDDAFSSFDRDPKGEQ